MTQVSYTLKDLLRVMQRLRDPQTGCPWDLEQNFRSIVPSTLEECYELAQAIEQNDFHHVLEELGDVLFQVIFYAQLGSEQLLFSFDTVVDTLVKKLLRRHPHVFADGQIEGVVRSRATLDEIHLAWEAGKQREREDRAQTGVLADVPVALPALPRAQKLQKRAAQVGFDWTHTAPVMAQLLAEIAELKLAIESGDTDATVDEMGDVLFSSVNLARHLNVDAESCLRRSNNKFEQRFCRMVELAGAQGLEFEKLDEQAMDELWRAAKSSLSEGL